MAIPRRLPLAHRTVFPAGAFLVSEVSAVRDYDKSTRDAPVQKRDEDTNLLVWQVDVLDADPEASRAQRTVSVKILAEHQPVPPKAPEGIPFTPIEFDDLDALPYDDTNGPRPRIMWSFRASGFKTTGKAA